MFELRKTNLGFLNRDLPVIGVSSTICLISFVIAKSTTSVHFNGKTTTLKSNQLNSSMSSWINISLFVVNHFTFYFFCFELWSHMHNKPIQGPQQWSRVLGPYHQKLPCMNYGNTGCWFLSSGKQNPIDLLLSKVKSFKWLHVIPFEMEW